MNQIKIGQFISAKRKAKNLTQALLAEKLGITDRAVSKWERGKGLPEVSLMLDLCEILGITVNELLSGEEISMENKNAKNEELLLQMAQEVEEKNKTIWTTMKVLIAVGIIGLLAGISAAALLIPEGVWQLVAILSICAVFITLCFYAGKLEISVGAYKCKKCGTEIVPTYKEYIVAQHLGFTRHLKCPTCNKRTWCKKVIKK